MPDLSGLPALDVVIGLAFMFFLLATACSAINEMLASFLGWRAKTLEDGVRSMLGEPNVNKGFKRWLGETARGAVGVLPKQVTKSQADRNTPEPDRNTPEADPNKPEADPNKPAADPNKPDLTTQLFEHWRVRGLVRNPDSKLRRRRRPSYLPPRALSLAVAEHFASLAPPPPTPPGKKGPPTPWELEDAKLLAQVQAALDQVDAPAVVRKAAVNAFGNLERFRTNVERAFDDAMTRAQGWYKRKVQLVLLIIAVALAVGLNVDTVHVGTRLWKDAALRAAVASKATGAVQGQATQSSGTQSGGTQSTAAATTSPAQDAADAVDKVKQLDLPVGWGSDNAPHGKVGALSSVPGWIITIAALTLGAPFWFDVLSRLARLRGSGGTQAGRALSDQEPSRRP